MSTPQIVTLNVTQTQAPLPNKLQKTGLMLSQGSTSIPVGTLTYITQIADLLAILNTATIDLASAEYANGNVNLTTATAHGLTVAATGQVVTIAGVVPDGYNGTWNVSVPSSTTLAYAAPNLGATTSGPNPATVTYYDQEILSAGTTWFSQGSLIGYWLLELGPGSTASGIAALTTFLQLNPQTYYGVLLPKAWANSSALLSLLASDEFLTAKIYFFITVTSFSYQFFNPLMKCAVCMFETPGAPALEFAAAAVMYSEISQDPSNVQKVPPFCYRFLYGVTPYPVKGNQAFLTTLKNLNVNYVATAAEGGITNTMLYPGTTMDGRDILYWYGVDWVEINIELDLSNEVINGSNNQINPLYYDQPGIDRLKARAQQTMNRGVTYGLVLAPVTVNAVPFLKYVLDNPSDFRTGVYKGLSTIFTPNRGFQSITFNANVTDFPAQTAA